MIFRATGERQVCTNAFELLSTSTININNPDAYPTTKRELNKTTSRMSQE